MSRKKLKNKDIDLLKVYSSKNKKAVSPITKLLAFPCVAAVLIGSTVGYLTLKNNALVGDIENINNEILELQTANASNPNLEKLNSISIMRAQAAQYQTFYEDIQSYPVLTQKTFDQILLASGLKIDVSSFSYIRESQIITLQIKATSATDTEQFIRRLKNTEEFSDVTYSGYSRSEQVVESDTNEQSSTTKGSNTNTQQETIVTSVVYTSTVLCKLK